MDFRAGRILHRARYGSGGFALTFQFLAQIADIHFEHIAFAAKVIAPDAVKDHFARQHLLGMTQEKLEQFVFLGGQ